MNKIFKVVWSKVKHCYVVVSEIAKNTISGGARRCRMGKVSLAAAMAAAVLTGSFVMPNGVRAETSFGTPSYNQYIAIALKDVNNNYSTEKEKLENDKNYELREVYVTDNAGNKVVVNGNYVTREYYVLKGYDLILRSQEQVKDQPNAVFENVVAEIVKNGTTIPNNANSLISAQSVISPIVDETTNRKVRTVLGTSLNSIGMSTYSAASNGGIIPYSHWEYIIEDSNSRWVNVNDTNNNASLVEVQDGDDGRYHYTTEDKLGNNNDHVVDNEENIYYLYDDKAKENKAYVFLRSDGTLYDGTVRGLHNEILMTAVTSNGNSKVLYTYWGSKQNDDETLVKESDITVGDLNKAFRTFEQNDENLAEADIANIKITKAGVDKNKGTLGLTRGSGEDVLGTITVESTGGTGGDDLNLVFTNKGVKKATQEDVDAAKEAGKTINLGDYMEDPNAVSTFTLEAGSKVVANNGVYKQGSTNVLETISINEQTYTIHDVAVSDEGTGRKGYNEVTANADEKHGWSLTDTYKTGKTFKDTTLVAGSANVDIEVDESDSNDSSSTRNFTIYDTAGNAVVLEDVASHTELQGVIGDVATNTSNITSHNTRIEAIEAGYIKTASVSSDGSILTLTKNDNETVTFTDTNNYVTDGSVSYTNGQGTLTLRREGLDDVIITDLQNTFLDNVGVDKPNNNIKFTRNDGHSYSVNFSAGGGALNDPGDTYIKIGGADGIKLSTGSKVEGFGTSTPNNQNVLALDAIKINGQLFEVPVVNANVGATDEDNYLTSIELNGETYKIVNQGSSTDYSIVGEKSGNTCDGDYAVDEEGKIKLNIIDNLTQQVEEDAIVIRDVASATDLNQLEDKVTTNETNISNIKGDITNIETKLENKIDGLKDTTLAEATDGLSFKDGELSMTVTDTSTNTVTGTANIGGYVGDRINTEAAGATFGDTTIGEAITSNADNIAQNVKDIATNTSRIEIIEENYVKDITQNGNSLTITQGTKETTFTFTDENTTNADLSNTWNNDDSVTITLTDSAGNPISTTISDIASMTDLNQLDSRVTTNETNISNIQGDITDIQSNITDIENRLDDKIDGLKDTTLVKATDGLSFKDGELFMTVTDTSTNTVTGTANISGYVGDRINTEAAGATFGDTTIGVAITSNADNIAKNAEDIAKNKTDIVTNAGNIAKNAEDIAKNKTDIAINADNIAQNVKDIATNTSRIEIIEENYVKDITQNGNSLTITQGTKETTFTFTDENTTNADLSNTWNNDDSVTITLTDSAGKSIHTTIQDVASATELDTEIVNRIANDEQLQKNIDTEAGLRAAGDAALDQAIKDGLKAEATKRAEVDGQLSDAIKAEIERASAAEVQLQANIDTEAGLRAAGDAALDQAIKDGLKAEAIKRAEVDGQLGAAIDSEIVNRIANDEQLQKNIDAEAAERFANDIASGAINSQNGAITLTKNNGETITLDGAICDSRLDNVSFDASTGKMTFTVKDHYNNDVQNSIVVSDIASKAALEKEVSDRIAVDNYLYETINKNDQYLDSKINHLGSKVNKVGAGAAALAALHPMDFDPDDKLSFSAGVGNYAGQTATALGAFYRPNEKVMMSIGGTYGNNENMVNMGVSFALDRTNNISNSRTAMAREIVDLREQVATQGQQIAQLVALVNQLAGVKEAVAPTVQPFPDVPANHWAYEYLNNLIVMGVIEGYPDGTFGGDRTMTRYEFATMLFKAMQNGAVLSEQIRQEFNAELGRIRVDRVKGADDDANKIERVRVNNNEDRDDYGSKIVQVEAGA